MSSPEKKEFDMPQPPDPAKDRDEFVNRLKRLMMREDHTKQYVEAMMDADAEMQAACINERKKQKARMKHYLDRYDAAKNEDEKRAVVGEVKPSYEPTVQEIAGV